MSSGRFVSRVAAALLLSATGSVVLAQAVEGQSPVPPAAASAPPPVVATPAAQADDAKALVRQAFGRVDSDKDGRLTHDEANALPPVAAKFDQLDTNKDGVISEDEFIIGVRIAG